MIKKKLNACIVWLIFVLIYWILYKTYILPKFVLPWFLVGEKLESTIDPSTVLNGCLLNAYTLGRSQHSILLDKIRKFLIILRGRVESSCNHLPGFLVNKKKSSMPAFCWISPKVYFGYDIIYNPIIILFDEPNFALSKHDKNGMII